MAVAHVARRLWLDFFSSMPASTHMVLKRLCKVFFPIGFGWNHGSLGFAGTRGLGCRYMKSIERGGLGNLLK